MSSKLICFQKLRTSTFKGGKNLSIQKMEVQLKSVPLLEILKVGYTRATYHAQEVAICEPVCILSRIRSSGYFDSMQRFARFAAKSLLWKLYVNVLVEFDTPVLNTYLYFFCFVNSSPRTSTFWPCHISLKCLAKTKDFFTNCYIPILIWHKLG